MFPVLEVPFCKNKFALARFELASGGTAGAKNNNGGTFGPAATMGALSRTSCYQLYAIALPGLG